MPRVDWNATGTRRFQTGIDRGMIYIPPYPGVAWNGLVSVSEAPSGGSANEFFIDGQKYMNVASLEEFAATIEAFSTPDSFAPCAGYAQLSPGLFVTNQIRQQFGFSYRTLLGDDVLGTSLGYKIHLVYNALAKTSDFVRETTTDSPNVKSRAWDISTVPVSADSYKPTSHFVVDSTRFDPSIITSLENILYGAVSTDPRLPDISELVTLVGA